MKGRNRPLAVIAVCTLVGLGALFSGCSDNENVAAPAQPAQVVRGTDPYTPANAEEAAGFAAQGAELMANIGNLFAGIIGGIAQELQPQQTGPSRLLAIGPIWIPSGLCVEGSAIADNVIYEDNALPGFSAGDTITVILDNCLSKLGYPDDNVYLSGNPANLPAIKFSIDNVVEGIVKGKLDLSIAVKDEFGTSTLAGTMPAEAFIGFLPSAGITLGKDNSTAQNNYIRIKEGAETLQFGCFVTYMDIQNVFTLDKFTVWIRGIELLDVPGLTTIQQLGDYNDNVVADIILWPDANWRGLNFISSFGGWEPNSGTLKMLGFDSRAKYGYNQCFNLPTQPTTGTTSMLATAGEGVRLDIFNNTQWLGIIPNDNSIYTTWGCLLNPDDQSCVSN